VASAYNGNNTPCGILDVGDPLESNPNYGGYPYSLHGLTYNLQDLVTLPYFGAPPSTTVNNWFTFQGESLSVCPNGVSVPERLLENFHTLLQNAPLRRERVSVCQFLQEVRGPAKWGRSGFTGNFNRGPAAVFLEYGFAGHNTLQTVRVSAIDHRDERVVVHIPKRRIKRKIRVETG
jgi:hypothetical protein